MKSIRTWFFLIPLLLMLNCASQKFYISGMPVTVDESAPDAEVRIHFFFYGVMQSREIDVKEVCGSKSPKLIITYYKFWEIFVGSMLHGIWRPSTYKIYCEK